MSLLHTAHDNTIETPRDVQGRATSSLASSIGAHSLNNIGCSDHKEERGGVRSQMLSMEILLHKHGGVFNISSSSAVFFFSSQLRFNSSEEFQSKKKQNICCLKNNKRQKIRTTPTKKKDKL